MWPGPLHIPAGLVAEPTRRRAELGSWSGGSHRPQLGRCPARIEPGELAVQAAQSADRRVAHIGGHAIVVVEDHRVYDVDPDAVGERVLEDGETARLEPAAACRKGVLDLDGPAVRRCPILEELDRLVAAVDAIGLRQRASLDVHVEPAYLVVRDDLLI